MAGLFNKLFGGEQINESTQTALNMLEDKLDELQQTHRHELEKYVQVNKQRLDELQIKYDKALVQQEDLYQDKLDRIEVKYDKVIAQQEKLYENKLGEICTLYDKKLEDQKAEYEQKLDEYIQINKKRLDEIQIKYDKALVQQEDLYQDKLDRIEVKYDKVVAQQEKLYKNKLGEICTQYDKKLEHQKAEYEQKLEEYIQINKKRLDEIQIKYDKALVQQEDLYQDKLDRIEIKYNKELEQQQKNYKESLAQVINKYDETIVDIQRNHKDMVAGVQAEIEQVEVQIQPLVQEQALYKTEIQLLQEKVIQQGSQLGQYQNRDIQELDQLSIKYEQRLQSLEEKLCSMNYNNEIQVLQSELATQKCDIEKVRLELTKQQEVEKLQPQEANVVAKNEDTVAKFEEVKEVTEEQEQPAEKKNLLDSILNYEWDDEEDFDFMEPYESKSVKQIPTETSVENVEGVEVKSNKNIYEQFKEYIAQNQIYGNPSKEFVLHAKWMAEYEEQEMPLEAVPFKSIEPSYKVMTIEQMRWYFYWRMNVRKGKFTLADIGYIVLYSYEILNNIGIKDYKEGHEKLISILSEYGETYKTIEGQLPQWIHDYVIIYGDAKDLFLVTEKLKEVSHGSHFVERAHFIKCLLTKEYGQLTELLNRFSDYKVIKQTLCKDARNRKLYDKVLEGVVAEIDDYLKKAENIDFAKKLMGPTKVDYWRVFSHAPVDLTHIEAKYPTYVVREEIKYWYDGKRWNTTYSGMRNDFDRIYITNLLKYIESVLCKHLNIKRELKLGTIPLYMERIVKEVASRYCGNSIEQTKSVESRLTSLKETEIKQSKVIQPTQVNVVTSQEDNIYNLIGKYLYNEKIRQNGYKFHKQAKSMEAQESFKITVSGGEDAQREAKLIEEYFNWRKEVRKGVYKRAERIYVYTYIYECINDIGIKNAKDGLDKLINILENYGNEFEGLQEQLSKWIIDYVIYYNCIPEERFYTVLKDINMNLPSLHDWNTVALLMGQQVSEPLVYLNRISSYDIYKSHYYFRSMETILNKVLRLVMCQMEKLLLVNKAPRLYEIVAGDKVTEKEWIPFENALFYNKAKHLLLNRKTEYIIGKHIRYSMRRGFWQTTMPDLTELENNEYIGNLLKCVEYHVCKKNGNYICDLKNINIPKYLEQAIENTVRECM